MNDTPEILTGKPNAALDALIARIPGGSAETMAQFVRAIEPWLRERIEAQAEARNLDSGAVAEAAHERLVEALTSATPQPWADLSRQFMKAFDSDCGKLEHARNEPPLPPQDVPEPDKQPLEHEQYMQRRVDETLASLTATEQYVLHKRLQGQSVHKFHATPEAIRQTQARAVRKLSETAAEMSGGNQQEIRKLFADAILDARQRHSGAEEDSRGAFTREIVSAPKERGGEKTSPSLPVRPGRS